MHTATAERIDIIERLYRLNVAHDCPIHISAATVVPDQWGVKRVVSGRGHSAEAAISRCIFEAVERHSAVYNNAHEIIQSSLCDLSPRTIDPVQLLQISDEQYVTREEWNRHVDVAHHIPQRFDETKTIGWVSVQSLSSSAAKFVPAACCFLGYPKAQMEGFSIPDSSGLAAGLSFEDAVHRGLLELIERDAVAIWWYNRVSMPQLAFDSAAVSWWAPFADWIKRCQRQFWLLDLTNDLGVPVAAAISCDEQGTDLSFGFGAGKSPEVAAESAMGELVQFEATKTYHRQQELKRYPHFLSWCKSAQINEHAFVVPAEPKRENQNTQSISVETIVERLARHGLTAFALEFPNAHPHIKVVRTFVPGLRPIWPRYAAGRLYDVPYELGWIKQRKQETELNPVPILY